MKLKTLTASIDAATESIVELETLLTSIPAMAPESGGDGELKKCEALEIWLKDHGITNLERFDAPDERVSSGIRPNLIATIDGKSTNRTTWVMAHMDVVPTGDLSAWNTDPWTVVRDGDKLYGRGVEDNQQGLCSAVFAALAFLENGIVPANTIKLLFVADEEVGSRYGIQYLLREHDLFKKEDLILIPDGGDSEGVTVEVAEKNIYWIKLTTKGKQSHGSMPNEGNNAMLAGCDLALRLNDLENYFDKKDDMFFPNYSTFQPTKKDANVETVNIIPGEDVFYMDCRILPFYTLDEVREEIAIRVAAVEKKYGVDIHVTEAQAESSPSTPVDAPVIQELSAAIEMITGKKAKTVGIGGGTVASYLRNEGFNATVWSTLDETMHQPNEYCKLENLKQDAKILAVLFS